MYSRKIAKNYERDGYFIARGLLRDEECEMLKTEALRLMSEHARQGATVYVGAAAQSAGFRALADDPRIVKILREIMPCGIAFMSDKIVFKSGMQRFATPWHIDAFYWKNTRLKLSVWIPLDDATVDNGTLMVVRGSHHRTWQPVKKRGANQNGPGDEFEQQIEQRVGWLSVDEVVCEIPRGSAVFFSDHLVHASCPSTSGRDRYAIISTYHAPGHEPFDEQFPARHDIVPAGEAPDMAAV